jgi:hypothetical protein
MLFRLIASMFSFLSDLFARTLDWVNFRTRTARDAFQLSYRLIEKRYAQFVALVLALFSSTWAYAQQVVPPETVDQALSFFPRLVEAITTGNHPVAYGIGVMILGVAFRQYVLPNWKLNADLLPIVIAALTALGTAALNVVNSVGAGAELDLGSAVMSGVVAAIFAGGTWSLIGKHLAKLILGEKYVEPPQSV